ncbi:uncharacterized protein LOC135127328 [Zophobas morio]|uniref:uncharacterized protein LOC135127328 n=1 Tax=Zophobas morio TaxID=2755281 RepID=UPI0030829753
MLPLCGTCEKRFHFKCVDVPESLQEQLESVPGLNWKCCLKKCVSFHSDSLNAFLGKKFEEMVSNLKEVFSDLKTDLIKNAERQIKDTFMDSLSDSLIGLNDYILYRTDRSLRGGEVCILLNRTLFKQFSVTNCSKNYGKIELIRVTCVSSCQSFSLVCIYRPPGASVVEDQLLFEDIKAFCSHYSNLLIFGDFNFPKISWPHLQLLDNDNSAILFADLLLETNLMQLVSFPNRFRFGQTLSLIDLILTNDPNLLCEISQQPPIGISDLCVIETFLQYHIPPTERYEQREYTRIDFDGLDSDLAKINWDSLYHTSNSIEAWDIFTNILSDLTSQNTTTFHIKYIRTKPWISSHFLKQAKIKKMLWNKFKVSGSQYDYDQHRGFSNKLKSDIRSAKYRYELNVTKRGPKAVYKFVRGKMLSKVSVPIMCKNDNTLAANEHQSANLLADFFQSVFTSEPHTNLPPCLSPQKELFLSNIDFTKFLKKVHQDLMIYLLLYSKNVLNSVLPPIWLQALITPIYKKGDKTKAENYRPISLTSICSKVMDRIIWNQMFRFLNDQSILSANQHGFLPGRSTVTCLLQCLNTWTISLDQNKPGDIIYLDFEKAFDRVPHRRLLRKLDNVGIRGLLLQWIEAFLRGRSFRVRVRSCYSSNREVLSCVSQGSVLGPILFLVYISDLLSLLKSPHAFYADDGRLFNNPLTSSQIIQSDLLTEQNWTSTWLMPLNNKECVVFRLGKDNPNIPYTLDNHVL